MTEVREGSAVPGGDVAPRPDELVYHTRSVPFEWEMRLREISPRSDVHSWLAFQWFAEAQRWRLYECVPIHYIEDLSLVADLGGPDPESPEGADVLVTRFQQEMFRTHRVHARPCWVIQGTHGGHHVAYSPERVEDHRRLGLPLEPPKAGALPYADFDERVVKQIGEMSKLVRFGKDFGEFKRRYGTAEGQKREATAALRAARERYVKWINSQFEDGDDEFVAASRDGAFDDAPHTDDDFVEKNERSDQKYIDRGRF